MQKEKSKETEKKEHRKRMKMKFSNNAQDTKKRETRWRTLKRRIF
jgi:hypothetical protein